MFEPSDTPRIFAMPPGADFPNALVQGLTRHFADQPPDRLARVQLIVNTRRMARRIATLFDDGPALLLPRISLVTDLGEMTALDQLPPPVPPLKRRLELVPLVSRFLDATDGFAPRASLYDLADSLARLMGEMQGEGVPPSAIAALDVQDQSGHWARTQNFLSIIQHYFEDTGEPPDTEARQRLIVERLIEDWQEDPPMHPVIIAGSTGSRGTTQLLMQAAARLPQGALVLPGFDFNMPAAVWDRLDGDMPIEDHPQYRFHALMQALGITRDDVRPWPDATAPNPARNRLVSLALRPAPVTDQWLQDGQHLNDLETATRDITLIEAPSTRDEALAIALRLRQAAENGETAALITPDRALTRQVAAALDRWNIKPDDSAGEPLQLSAIGRLMRHIAALFEHRLTADALLTLLKHPLTHSAADRGPHLLLTQELELHIRRHGPPYPDAAAILNWAQGRKTREADDWAAWVADTFTGQNAPGEVEISARLDLHLDLLMRAMRGPDTDAVPHPWDHADGKAAKQVIDDLALAAPSGGALNARDYADLFGAILSGAEVREVETPHPHILIWGTLEARVQGPSLLILAGLNEGTWPEAPTPDPWLNRRMRNDAGLLLPERNIGLSAHDFQQAIAAPEVWLTRSTRSEDAETVVSRWLNRLSNLLNGLPDRGGDTAYEEMQTRGRTWLARAAALEDPGETASAPRPAPRPPLAARPRRLSVTEIRTLIRDPYAIYAKHVLGLRPLDPLMRLPDALIRGIAIHEVLEKFIQDTVNDPALLTRDHLMATATQVFEKSVPWPAERLVWLARLERVADSFIANERARQAGATPAGYEIKGRLSLPELDFELSGTADRIDRADDGSLLIYDYKTGTVPSKKAQEHFDKQLLLETIIAENAGFGDLAPAPVSAAVYIGLGSSPGETPAPLAESPPATVLAELRRLIARYQAPDQGYLSRRAMFTSDDQGSYDQLARFGEWDITEDAEGEDLE
ncbi:double-strand break repair protein AddB [Marimonas lutisalis]|uniref:double-strand break repair protein AddB n=1 Tax=Marimonas lutisalis TaxID=2545756 RepID=UPI0010F8B154|nr:double-strand break repair protein AddB [Marimonas lutisalis]